MDRFKNKYRISSIRLQKWDYGWNGAYFITICTHKREYFFGEIRDDKMQLSEIGKLANQFLLEIPKRYDYAILDEFVVMPNHIHAIVIIAKTDGDGGPGGGNRRDAINRVSTGSQTGSITDPQTKPQSGFQIKPESKTDQNNEKNSKNRGGITGNKNPMLHENISRILNWYTGRVTFESRKIDKTFTWQSRFHDHIIRNKSEYYRIKNYIINNPKNWQDDSLHE